MEKEDVLAIIRSEIETFYEEKTGRSAKQGASRIEKIMNFLGKYNVFLEDIKLEMHNDYRWNLRANRTDLEKQAVCIGSTNDNMSGFIKEMWWVVQK